MEHYSLDQLLKRHPRLTLPCHKGNVHSIRWNPEGNYLASGGKDKTMYLHRISESEIISEPRYPANGHSGDIEQLCWNPDDSNLLATASADKSVKIWDVRYTEPVMSVKLKNENMAISWSNLGNTIAVADKSDLVSFIEPRKGFEIVRDQKLQFEIGEIAWNPDGDLLLVTSGDGKIHVISYPDLQAPLVLEVCSSPCLCIRFDQTGKYFATGSNDATASVWDTENLICFQAITRSEWPVSALSFSCDSKYLASGSEDSHIYVADIHTGEQVSAIEVNQPVPTLDFHPKEYVLAYTVAAIERDYRDVGTIKVVGFPEERRRGYN